MFKPPDYVETYIPLETPVPLKNQVNHYYSYVIILADNVYINEVISFQSAIVYTTSSLAISLVASLHKTIFNPKLNPYGFAFMFKSSELNY